jgi:hypothetical protein
MKYRLKSDPSMVCETVCPIPSHVPQVAYVYEGVAYRCPGQAFLFAWEPVPEEKPVESTCDCPCHKDQSIMHFVPCCGPNKPAVPEEKPAEVLRSIEEICECLSTELMAEGIPSNSARSAIAASTLDRAAAEIRGLRARLATVYSGNRTFRSSLYKIFAPLRDGYVDDTVALTTLAKRAMERIRELEEKLNDPHISRNDLNRAAELLDGFAWEVSTMRLGRPLSSFEATRIGLEARAYELAAQRLRTTELAATDPSSLFPTPES